MGEKTDITGSHHVTIRFCHIFLIVLINKMANREIHAGTNSYFVK